MTRESWAVGMRNAILRNHLNPFLPKSDLLILLRLTPDDFTRQREAPWAGKGYDTRTEI